MSTDILLISPSYIFTKEAEFEGIDSVSTTPPQGLLYVAAMLQQNGYTVNILDMHAEGVVTQPQLVRRLKRVKPQAIGITSLSNKFQNVVDITRICKETLPSTPVMLGGYFATFTHDRILATHPEIDFIVRNEGEITATELVKELEKTRPQFSSIHGLSFRENGRVQINEARPHITDLDTLPFPAYELVAHIPYGSFGLIQTTKRNLGAIVSSRGCNYRCTYCACSNFTGHTIRSRSPENVVEELQYYAEDFGLKEIIFLDDNLTYDRKRVLKLCQVLRKEGLDIEWFGEGRVNQVDEVMFRTMRETGFRVIYFGIESCVDRILKYYRKGATYTMIQNAVRTARKAQLEIVGSFILGAPVETVDEMWETIHKASQLDIDFAQFNPLVIYYGTPLWNQLVEADRINNDTQWQETLSGFALNPYVPYDKMHQYMRQFNRAFYFRKGYILKQALRSLVYRKKMIFLNLQKFRQVGAELQRQLWLRPPRADTYQT